MKCWKCGTLQKHLPEGKLSFRAECEKCTFALHSCKNCRFYKRGLPNDCMVPGTEMIGDREKQNFCEEFEAKKEQLPEEKAPEDAAKRLFGDEAREISKKPSPEERFNSLFGDY